MNPYELPKAQWVRLADVFFIGPLMAYGGVQMKDRHPIAGLILAGLGVATVAYNGRNYLRIRDQQRSLSGRILCH